MDWRDEGILLTVRRHGESAAIIDVLTAAHGRHAGVVRGGGSRKMAPVLQPGAVLSLDWSARLEDHIGTYRIDPMPGHIARIMADRAALAALGAMTALVSASLPEREAHGRLYTASRELLAALGVEPDWPARYAIWEMELLADLGFGLDLAACAATGATEDLIWVSPKTGRVVSRAAGAPWADRLLPLPGFLRGAEPAAAGDVAAGLRLTGYFLETRLAPHLSRGVLPEARGRAVEALVRVAGTGPEVNLP